MLADLKGKPIAIGAASNTTFWPWLKQKYGFTDEQKRPYGFSVQPFLADPSLAQQGFATSEPYSIEKGGDLAGRVPARRPGLSAVLRIARGATGRGARQAPTCSRRFLHASAEGWKSYLANPAPAHALIRRDNPQMSDELLPTAIARCSEYAIVAGGDAPQARAADHDRCALAPDASTSCAARSSGSPASTTRRRTR